MSWLDNALNAHSSAVLLRAKRAEILAANLANADTPGYKARDLDFKQVYSQVRTGGGDNSQSVTHRSHFPIQDSSSMQVSYRTPHELSTTGNTVEKEVEQTEFTENSVRYLVSLQLLSRKISGISRALKGE